MEKEIKTKLQNFPEFRERRFRSKYLAILALRSLGSEQRYKDKIPFTLEELAEFALKFDSYDRIWRKVLSENKELQGTDYGEDDDTKTILEQDKMLELGYEPNYNLKLKIKI